jgi:PAS domain S-box-containing protein
MSLQNNMPGTAQYFEFIFNNARQNGVLIMDENGIVQKVNSAFTTAYGYTTDDLAQKHFRLLFLEKDQVTRKPELELEQTHREGSGPDENYLVHKDGTPIWVSGESILVKDNAGTCIVKIIHNIHAQKQLERYLLSSTELLDSLFESVPQSGLLLLNTQMKAVKANSTFRKIFGLEEDVHEGARLQDIKHPLWQQDEVKAEVRNALVNGVKINKTFSAGGETSSRYHITSKLMISDDMTDKTLLLNIKEA